MKFIFHFIILFLSTTQIAAQPYFLDFPGAGLGQYGYIEKDAVTFARIARGSYNNVRDLAARWYVDDLDNNNGLGIQKIYKTSDNPAYAGSITWQCGFYTETQKILLQQILVLNGMKELQLL
jgi:hypothetical protein